jgi:predicted ferric reductase
MQRYFVLALAVLAGVWLGAVPADTWTLTGGPADFWRLRRTFILGTGYVAMGCMSIAMIVAARPVWLERVLGGLDQFYRMHKRLGIAAAVLGLVHWLLEIVPRWMVGQGWLVRPQRGAPAAGASPEPFAAFKEPAAELGEWGLYLVLALVVVALWKRIPYRYFAKLHRILPVAYLLLVFHAVVFMPVPYWTHAAGPLVALLMAAGVVAAVLSLAGQIGFRRRALGHVDALKLHDDRVLEVHCQLETPWAGHESGQFVFVTFDRREGAHPFTVVSAWQGDGRLVLAIKGLGDYTSALPSSLALGSGVTVEGPYGQFNFAGTRERQIWIAGGIGITPFISRLLWLAQQGATQQPVDLFDHRAERGAAVAPARAGRADGRDAAPGADPARCAADGRAGGRGGARSCPGRGLVLRPHRLR